MDVLEDVLEPGLRVVFCGVAAGPRSACEGAYYAEPRNQFWDILHKIGLTPRRLKPHEFRALLGFGVGLTDLVKDKAGSDRSIRVSQSNIDVLRRKIDAVTPKALAFNGKRAAEAFFRHPAQYGKQPESVGLTAMWVLPSTSPAARRWWGNGAPWKELAATLGRRRTAGLAG
ncbi:MAG: mismatch-specific DNA-glycosylase [Chloroflexi bacterium]|nr:mismatch-specific DNA-glycosylase [Chloroflexota bacterium]